MTNKNSELCKQCESDKGPIKDRLKGFCTCENKSKEKVPFCKECKSDSYYDYGEYGSLLLHEKTCSEFQKANRKFKAKVTKKENEKYQIKHTRRNIVPTEEEKVKQENQQLRRKFDGLMEAVSNSLITIDWAFKIGLPLGLLFFPLVQDRWYQAIGVFVYVILLTLISKAIIKVKSYRLDD